MSKTKLNKETKICKICNQVHEEYYTKENFPSLSYGSHGSPNPPHIRGLKIKGES